MSKIDDSQIIQESHLSENSQETDTPRYLEMVFSLAFKLISAIFSTIVTVLNYYFPRSLDGTYLKLFFS